MKKLGFGLMRLPLLNKEDPAAVDIEQVKRMVDLFIEKGFTYFDTAWMYCGFNSENVVKEALINRHPRETFTLATKMHAGFFNTKEEREQVFEQQRVKTGAEYFDYYLIHGISANSYEKHEELDSFGWLREKKEQGLVKHMGFSFHDSAELLDKILTAHPEMEFVQLQINYADWENPTVQSRGCYEVAKKHGKPIIVMEPVKGGMLATPPESVVKIFKEAEPDSSVASWAVRFAADLDGVMTVLSGMSNVAQMEDNLSYMREFTGLTAEQRETLKNAQEELARIPMIPCTVCNYCAKVCPMQIGISGSFTAMNYLTLYRDKAMAQHQESWLVSGHGLKQAKECIGCGKCEEACPQHIAIREELKKVTEELL